MQNGSRIALVTGASKGVGRGIAYGLARHGWDLAVNYHSDKAGAVETAEEIRRLGRRCWVLPGDVGESSDTQAMFESLQQQASGLNLLVNNAGTQAWSSLLDLREQDWDRTIRTNLKGTFLCTQQAARLMQDTGGCIVNIGSGCNKIPFPRLVEYTASKGGIENLTRVSAIELGKYGITVNCVAPGAIEIERTREEDPNYAETWGAITPIRRVGTVEDVAAAVVFFASPEASFITGQPLYVDGGLWTQAPWPYEVT
jgi:NAD(P)-dependent dehydrogenase (short-subunit alcohol dehydrogenase family)